MASDDPKLIQDFCDLLLQEAREISEQALQRIEQLRNRFPGTRTVLSCSSSNTRFNKNDSLVREAV